MKVIIPNNTKYNILAALNYANKKEVGGLLIGEIINYMTIEIINMTSQSKWLKSFFLRKWSRKEKKELNDILDQYGNNFSSINYCGEWHSHPSFSLEPSNRDIKSMWELCFDVKVSANFLILLIVKSAGKNDLQAKCYYFNKENYPIYKQVNIEFGGLI